MQQGTVKFFNASKGFGFITPDNGDKDVFVPAASVVSSGVGTLKTGQRISFEAQPDSKGPKAINLVVLADVRPQPKVAVTEPVRPKMEEGPRLTLYHDPDNAKSRKALADLRAAGHDPRIMEYLTTPLTKEELKILSVLVGNSGQSLVRKYDPLFLGLRLDDRFISDNEFWDAIVEHPSLIDGPIVATSTRACLCKAENSVKAFLTASSSNGSAPPAKQKVLPPRLLNLLRGEVIAPSPNGQVNTSTPVKGDVISTESPKAEIAAASKGKSKPKSKPVSKKKVKVSAKSKSPAKKKPPKAAKKAKRKSAR